MGVITLSLQHLRYGFSSDEILHRLPGPNHVILVAIHQNLGRLRMRIVIGRHGKTVSTGAHHGQQITAAWTSDFAVHGEKVAALTNGADNIGNDLLGSRLNDRTNLLVG